MKVFLVNQATRRGRQKLLLSADSFCHALCRVLDHYPGSLTLQLEDVTLSKTPQEFFTEAIFKESTRTSRAVTVVVGIVLAIFFSHHATMNALPVVAWVLMGLAALYGLLMALFNAVQLAKSIKLEQWSTQPVLPDQLTFVAGNTVAAIEREGESEFKVTLNGTLELGKIFRQDHEHIWSVRWVDLRVSCFNSFDRAVLEVCQRLSEHLAGS